MRGYFFSFSVLFFFLVSGCHPLKVGFSVSNNNILRCGGFVKCNKFPQNNLWISTWIRPFSLVSKSNKRKSWTSILHLQSNNNIIEFRKCNVQTKIAATNCVTTIYGHKAHEVYQIWNDYGTGFTKLFSSDRNHKSKIMMLIDVLS